MGQNMGSPRGKDVSSAKKSKIMCDEDNNKNHPVIIFDFDLSHNLIK
jgi:hypothetical protein